MKKTKSLLAEVLRADYTIQGEESPSSPSVTGSNLKRLRQIRDKMRKAGITDEEVEFIRDFAAADAVHVVRLMDASEAFEAKQNGRN